MQIRSDTVLPARREQCSFETLDGVQLVGELAVPEQQPASGTIVLLHPLPTHGGFMDSHIIKKASYRLPALASIATLRFNFRGVTSPRGTSGGTYDEGRAEGHDLHAALEYVSERKELPKPWLVGWSFGTEVILRHAANADVAGVILLSPPLRRGSSASLPLWHDSSVPMTALVPEHDDYLQPAEARLRFAQIPHATVVGVDGARHLWVGETYVRRVLNEIAERVVPGSAPLATEYPPLP